MAVTIRDVAKEAGVSISTVSKVIHDAPTISGETKQRIRDIMERLNYYPNIIARSFARQSSYHVGLIMSLQRSDAFLNPYIYEILGGIEEAAKKNGYSLSLINMSTIIEDPRELERLIVQKRVDGLLIHLTGFSKSFLKILERHDFPFIFIGQPTFRSNACWVDINNTQAGEIAASHLIEQGCRRIAFMGDGLRNFICQKRYKGYQKALASAGMKIDTGYLKETSGQAEAIPGLMDELLTAGEIPDGLVCSDNFIAFEALKALQKKGIAVPSDISLITFDNYPFAPYTSPALSVVDIDVFELGVQSANALINKLGNTSLNIQFSLLSPSLIKRESSLR